MPTYYITADFSMPVEADTYDDALDKSLDIMRRNKQASFRMDNILENPYNKGDWVKIDDDDRLFRVHSLYSTKKVSLGLYDYPDVEQDTQIHVNRLRKVER